MACVIVGSETGAEYAESRGCGVVMGPTGRGHPTDVLTKDSFEPFRGVESIEEQLIGRPR